MRSFSESCRRGLRVVAVTLLSVLETVAARPAEAQGNAQGFALERLTRSAPGAGWMVMDDLSIPERLSGTIAISAGYSHDALRIATSDGLRRLAVVADESSGDIGASIAYRRVRLSLSLPGPLLLGGQTGNVGAYAFAAPTVDLGRNPDTFSDARLGADVLLWSRGDGALRLGVGALLFVPSGSRADYVTDGTYRGMVKVLAAGKANGITFAGHLGVHLRPLDDSPVPGSPQGSELLFGLAAGPRYVLNGLNDSVVIGPEIFGESAFRSLFGLQSTGVEGLLSARFEAARDRSVVRIKAGAGVGLDAHFGAPEWRSVVSVEISDRPSEP